MKMRGRNPVIHVARNGDGRCRASFHTDLLGAVFAVSFSESLTGAVALHRFVHMIEVEYGKPAELRIDDPFPVRNRAVAELLHGLQMREPVCS